MPPSSIAVVFDASAVLTMALREPGHQSLLRLERVILVSTVNLAEVRSRLWDKEESETVIDEMLGRIEMSVVTFDAEQAKLAADLRPQTRRFGLSLGDRACLALGIVRKANRLHRRSGMVQARSADRNQIGEIREFTMPLLEVKNLQVRVEEREILHGLSLTVNKGEVHAIMGPNGSGKSTLSHVIAGKPGYEVTSGEILFEDEDLLAMSPDERAAKGVFLAFQYPVEIPGVATMTFLRTALNAQRKARGESEFSTPDFLKKVRQVAAALNIPQDMLRRGVNVGFSGGEKKRNEILQMALFEPSLCILDEMDSGLDIDALRVAADGVNALRSADRAMVVITHYQRLLNYIVPDFVHVMSKGRVVKSGGKELALELEENGYAQFEDAA
jgi:Fe-S cluster assembly ATP-binding protein